jgi:hypothetical protein
MSHYEDLRVSELLEYRRYSRLTYRHDSWAWKRSCKFWLVNSHHLKVVNIVAQYKTTPNTVKFAKLFRSIFEIKKCWNIYCNRNYCFVFCKTTQWFAHFHMAYKHIFILLYIHVVFYQCLIKMERKWDSHLCSWYLISVKFQFRLLDQSAL